jgi:hypothetical protein
VLVTGQRQRQWQRTAAVQHSEAAAVAQVSGIRSSHSTGESVYNSDSMTNRTSHSNSSAAGAQSTAVYSTAGFNG